MKKYCVLLLALLCMAPAAADVYKWKDEKGVTHYGDDPRAAGKGAATVKSAAPGADADAAAAAALIPARGEEGKKAGQASDFNGLPVETVAKCLVYARHFANADPNYSHLLHGPGNPAEYKHRIEATCPGVVFHCATFINRENENFCEAWDVRKGQEPLVRHEVRMCDASCPKH